MRWDPLPARVFVGEEEVDRIAYASVRTPERKLVVPFRPCHEEICPGQVMRSPFAMATIALGRKARPDSRLWHLDRDPAERRNEIVESRREVPELCDVLENEYRRSPPRLLQAAADTGREEAVAEALRALGYVQ